MSYSLNSLKRVIYGNLEGTTIGVIKGDTYFFSNIAHMEADVVTNIMVLGSLWSLQCRVPQTDFKVMRIIVEALR